QRLCGCGAALHVHLLGDLENVRHGPVEDEPGRQVQEHEREDHGHQQHHLRLARVAHRRCHLLLDEHGDAHEYRQDVCRICCGKVTYPKVHAEELTEADERCALHLHRHGEGHVERVEHRNLHDHGETPPERIHSVLPVQLHRLSLDALRV